LDNGIERIAFRSSSQTVAALEAKFVQLMTMMKEMQKAVVQAQVASLAATGEIHADVQKLKSEVRALRTGDKARAAGERKRIKLSSKSDHKIAVTRHFAALHASVESLLEEVSSDDEHVEVDDNEGESKNSVEQKLRSSMQGITRERFKQALLSLTVSEASALGLDGIGNAVLSFSFGVHIM